LRRSKARWEKESVCGQRGECTRGKGKHAWGTRRGGGRVPARGRAQGRGKQARGGRGPCERRGESVREGEKERENVCTSRGKHNREGEKAHAGEGKSKMGMVRGECVGEARLQRGRSTRRGEAAHGGGEHESGEAHESRVSMCEGGRRVHERWETHT